jgi:cytochrome c-type biogenesis protein CcmH
MQFNRTNIRLSARFILTALVTTFILGSLLSNQSSVDAQEKEYIEPRMIALTDEARSIASKLQCPVCDGQSIIESQATVSLQMKQKVQELVDQGKTEHEILVFFEERYGLMVLREPPYSGFGLGVWLIPSIVIGSIGTWGIFLLKRKNRQYKTKQ